MAGTIPCEAVVKQGFDDHSQTRRDMAGTIPCEAVVKQGFDDHSLPRWDATITIRRETAVIAWIRRSLTR